MKKRVLGWKFLRISEQLGCKVVKDQYGIKRGNSDGCIIIEAQVVVGESRGNRGGEAVKCYLLTSGAAR